MSTTVVDRIGLLVTGDPSLGEGPLGLLRDAAVVIEGGAVVSIERAGALADERIDAAGRCVLPGFVDSHTHLVFAGDRSDEFAARMAGAAYTAGGIQSTVAATRAATDDELLLLTARRQREAWRAGITSMEIKSGYGLDTHHEARCLDIATSFTADTTFLGAHVVPPEFAGRDDDYVHLVCTDMLAAAAPHARWIDAFCEHGAFDADQCRRFLLAAKAARFSALYSVWIASGAREGELPARMHDQPLLVFVSDSLRDSEHCISMCNRAQPSSVYLLHAGREVLRHQNW